MLRFPIISAFVLILCLTACSEVASNISEPVASDPVELSFHVVRKESNSEAAIRLALDGKVPPGTAFFKEKNGDGLIVEKRTKVNQNCLESVSSGTHPLDGVPIINFQFDEICTKLFGELTSKSIGERFAIVLNGEILTAPTINGAITAGTGFVEGGFTKDDVEKIVQDLLPYTKRNKLTNSR